MHPAFRGRRHRRIVAGILLVTLLTRALMPPGFMPAQGHGLALQICPDGFSSQVLSSAFEREHPARHSDGASHHHHGPAGPEHCVFAALAAGAGTSDFVLMVRAPLASPHIRPLETTSPVNRSPRERVQQPRAPPLPA